MTDAPTLSPTQVAAIRKQLLVANTRLVAIERKTRTVSAVGDAPVVLRIDGAEATLAPGERRTLATHAAVAVIGPDGPHALAWEPPR